MAHGARKFYTDDEAIAAGGNIPTTPVVPSWQEMEARNAGSETCVAEVRHRTSNLVDSAMQSIAEAYRLALGRGNAVYHDVSLATLNLTRGARDRALQFKREKPFTLLALVAGAALVLGFIARIGRSRHHA